ncbi:MAG: hypothetical protein IH602_22340 [Bryobacteraceae bacterium]|nr:hypothetical protein [Bryobacteraceae bacterium]
MKSWLGKFIRRGPPPPEPLKGSPAVARVKHYSALSGYVYEYVYQGYLDTGSVRSHRFRVSADRKVWFDLEVAIQDEGVRAWEQANDRQLNAAERYAVAKLALFAAFDERETPAAMRQPVNVPAQRIAALLESIDF